MDASIVDAVDDLSRLQVALKWNNFSLPENRTRKATSQSSQLKLPELRNGPKLYRNILQRLCS